MVSEIYVHLEMANAKAHAVDKKICWLIKCDSIAFRSILIIAPQFPKHEKRFKKTRH